MKGNQFFFLCESIEIFERLKNNLFSIYDLQKVNEINRIIELYDVYGGWFFKKKQLVFKESDSLFWAKLKSKKKRLLEPIGEIDYNDSDCLTYEVLVDFIANEKFKKALSFHSLFKNYTIKIKEEFFELTHKKGKSKDQVYFSEITFEKNLTKNNFQNYSLILSRNFLRKKFKSEIKSLANKESIKVLNNLPEVLYECLNKNFEFKLSDLEFSLQKSFLEDSIDLALTGLQNLKNLESGIAKNIDAEFLHDFRVNLRKLRSLVKYIKNDFQHAEGEKLSSILKNFQKKTNALRDADVLLQKKDFITNAAENKVAMELFFQHLKNYRNEEQKKVAEYVMSQEYRNDFLLVENILINKKLEINFSDGSLHSTKEAIIPILTKIYDKIRKIAKKIIKAHKIEDLHKLRIRLKEFRYLMEFYRKGIVKSKAKKIYKVLKEIQDFLGEYQDLESHKNKLKKIFERIKDSETDVSQIENDLNYLESKFNYEQKILISKYQDKVLRKLNKKLGKQIINALI